MKNSSASLHRSYFNVLKTTSPNAYELYVKLGNGDVKYGYDVFVNTVFELKNKVCDIYFEIKEFKEMSLIEFNKKIISENKDIFRSKRSMNNIIWYKIFNVDSLNSYKAYYQLKAIIKSYKLYKLEKGLKNGY